MIHVVAYSGGKDSTALVLWLREQGIEHRAVFCDTGWEHPITYAYVGEINRTLLGGTLITLRSEKYDGFADLVVRRSIVPMVHGRFCTEELKVFPLHAWIEAQDDEVTVYQGIRAEESAKRAAMPERQWVEDAGGYWIERPLFRWTAAEVFALHRQHGIEPNPLYLMGAGRVGCWPCIMVSKREMKAYLERTPEIRERLITLERDLNAAVRAKNPAAEWRSFFRSDYIPQRWATEPFTTKDGRHIRVPTAEDVFRYLESEPELPFEAPSQCLSIYNLCE